MVIKINYPEIGICGLSCRLCPNYLMNTKSRCLGCKSESRIAVGCPFITCAIKKKEVEFCWDCEESKTCEKWRKHREAGKRVDSFKCYQKLEEDITFIQKTGVPQFVESQKIREQLLREMIQEFNEGRSKSYYCIAATVLEIDGLKEALVKAKNDSEGLTSKNKSKLLHSILDEIAKQRKYYLKLRK
ncbi:MAG: DUF3795 domain-containing protein [Candidatus Methanospirareceae archaeon]